MSIATIRNVGGGNEVLLTEDSRRLTIPASSGLRTLTVTFAFPTKVVGVSKFSTDGYSYIKAISSINGNTITMTTNNDTAQTRYATIYAYGY